MSQIAFAFASVVLASNPSPTGRASSDPDRTEQVQHQTHDEPAAAPPATTDAASEFSEEEIAHAMAWAQRNARAIRQRIAKMHATPETVERQRRFCALAERMLLAELAAPLETDEPVEEPEPAPKREPKSFNPRAPRWSTSTRRARAVEESAAPVPAAPRRPQPTADEVLANYRPLKPPTRRAAGGEE